MAMSSYYSNRDTSQYEFNSDISSLSQTETQLIPPELFINNFELSDPFCNNIDYLFETNDLFNSENFDSLFPDLSTPPYYNLNSTSQEFEPFHCPKRQKTTKTYEPFYSNFNVPEPDFINGLLDYEPELIIPPLPDLPTASPAYNKPPSGGSLSAQTIAARQRRRKISEKTQELGKLIPGGNRMNTAEMLQSAYKYIKFLQAQVEILQLMGSTYYKENETEELHGFLESRLVQEKLYSNEKCLVSWKLVEEVANDSQFIESKPQVASELRKLARTNPSH
ncbi:hypothetical protein CDL12_03182 [Handroanthus impetiginosus]|uniref:BHLH domain-containing protein n=1 Tax=Handroanthus impetiginosus TaxID=429701 RepID=A0A2G9I2V9_9LAMI|nr:hypothetical protein CDL12_03182 [Handroanthus impetiginosus]